MNQININQIATIKDSIEDLQEYLNSEGCRYCIDAYISLQNHIAKLETLQKEDHKAHKENIC